MLGVEILRERSGLELGALDLVAAHGDDAVSPAFQLGDQFTPWMDVDPD
jgi:hypothetical protein